MRRSMDAKQPLNYWKQRFERCGEMPRNRVHTTLTFRYDAHGDPRTPTFSSAQRTYTWGIQ